MQGLMGSAHTAGSLAPLSGSSLTTSTCVVSGTLHVNIRAKSDDLDVLWLIFSSPRQTKLGAGSLALLHLAHHIYTLRSTSPTPCAHPRRRTSSFPQRAPLPSNSSILEAPALAPPSKG